MPTEWIRIPAPIPTEQDRRELCCILAAHGLEVRIVRVKTTNRGTPKRYVEYRPGPIREMLEIPAPTQSP